VGIATVAGGAGSVDTPRDVLNFAVKFYTKEGNRNLIGNNIPAFFIQDAIKFPDLIHAVKMEPERGFPQSATGHDTFWDFISLTPESSRLSTKRLWKRIERRTRYIEPDQLAPWWQAVQSIEDQPQYPSREVNRDYLVLLLLTGLQRTEALRLRWEDVNLQLGTLRAGDTKNHSDHVLPMGRYLWKLMRRRWNASQSDWVFADPLTGSRITDPHRQVVNVVAKRGVSFSPHDLRRSFASIVSRLGDRLSYYTTKRLLNHRTSCAKSHRKLQNGYAKLLVMSAASSSRKEVSAL